MSALRTLRLPAFRRLSGAYAISRLGDVLALVALASIVYGETHSTVATTGLFLALEFAPALLAPALTARVDRVPVARVLGTIYTIEAVLFAALTALSHAFALAPFLALVAVDGLLAVVARAVSRGAMAGVLEPTGELREGNALLNMAVAPAMAVGGALGGLILATAGGDVALAADAASFVVAALLVGTCRGLPRYEGEEDEDDEHWRVRLRAAIDYLRERPLTLVLLFGQAAAVLFFAMSEPIEIAYTRDSLHAGAGAYGALLSAWGVGLVLGSLLYASLARSRFASLALLSTLLQGGSYLALGTAPNIQIACAIGVVGGIANGVQYIALSSAIQEQIELAYQARVMALFEAMTTVTPGLGYLAGGGLAALAGGRAAFIAAGIGVFATVAVVLVSGPVRSASRRARGGARLSPVVPAAGAEDD